MEILRANKEMVRINIPKLNVVVEISELISGVQILVNGEVKFQRVIL